MSTDRLDILYVGDPRFQGGTSTALASEILAAEEAGFRVGLLTVRGPIIRRPHLFHPGLRKAIESGAVSWIDPDKRLACSLLIVSHPTLFPTPLERRTQITAEHAVIVAQHPPIDGAGGEQYDINSQIDSIAASFGCQPIVAPVGPNVRQSFEAVKFKGLQFTPEDWHNLLDLRVWPRNSKASFSNPIVVGRHSRPDRLKWPDTPQEVLACYPSDRDFQIRVLGSGSFIEEFFPTAPSNWELLPFGSVPARDFLVGLDAYVYFHSTKWIEAFGISVLEALAVGLITVLPKSFQPLFGDAAVYANPRDVRELLLNFRDTPGAVATQSARARAIVEDFFSLERYRERLERLFGLRPPNSFAPKAVRYQRRPRSILIVTSNGIGLGHLTRQIAIAKRLPKDIKAVFFTLSRGAMFASEAGFLVEHTMFHRYARVSPASWNAILAEEIFEALLFHRPEAVVFDGNVPYQGLVDAIASYQRASAIWVRRAMWRPSQAPFLKRAPFFDAVIEPRELAGQEDEGPTRHAKHNVLEVDPILLVMPADRLRRDEAMRLLDADRTRTLVAVQLGSGNNFDLARIRHALIERLLRYENIDVVEFVSPILDRRQSLTSMGPTHRIIQRYPTYMLSPAFDFMISGAGYNSFHEAVFGAVPTLFVPNEAEEMDMQDVRARFAERHGVGLRIRATDVYGVEEALAEMLDPNTRNQIRERSAKFECDDGAAQAAQFIEETVFSCSGSRASL